MYRKTLLLLKDLLHNSENYHWEQWIERDIYEWDNSKSTSHHKSAFGGMGSINDLYVGEIGKIGMWKDNTFDILKSISWTFATTNKIQFPKTNISNIEGVICRDCSYSEISEIGIERYISKKHLPTIIANILPTDHFLDLLNFETLTIKQEIEDDRQKLLLAITEFNINISKKNIWLKTCPCCNSNNTCVYRWDISMNEDKIILTKSKNNLTTKADLKNKTGLTWWKRIMGYS
jgi:hypothetical protein